jgi:hypothetical protein
MLKKIVLSLVFALLPSACWAQTTQENYLPAKSQLYFRWDGMLTHRADFNKTALGKTMQGDTGKFLSEFWKYAETQLQNAARNHQPKIADLLKDFTKLVSSMHEDGIVLGVEVDTINPPVVQAVLVFPKAAGESGTLLPLVTKIAEETKADMKVNKVGKRFVHHVEIEFVKFAWWAQGEDAVLLLGTTDPVEYAKSIDAKTTGLANNPLYKKVAEFKEFKTASRGYLDVARLLIVAAGVAPPADKVIDELGLKGLKNITFASGFDGLAERSIVDVDMPKRDGLLSFTSQRKISLKDLPVLPNDVTGFAASTIKLDQTYDTILKLIDGVSQVVAPNEADNIKEAIKAFEGTLGVDISKDLFGNFGDLVVSYNSPSDGFLGTGAVVAIQIKDGKKLGKTLEKIAKAIPPTPGGDITLKRKPYLSGETIQLQMSGMNNSHLATFGIYKNWFVYAQYPQPVKGFIMRQEGELPAWKADDSLSKALTAFPKEFNAIKVSDPRPPVQTVLSIVPLGVNILNSLGGLAIPNNFRPFDLDLIPHSQEATRHLFPNISVTTDDGKRIRTETRGSLVLPF